jgi:DNA-binding NarL/FixJ family response regulator
MGNHAEGDLDLIVVELSTLGTKSFERLSQARETCPTTRFLAISASHAKTDVLNCLAAGLHGFVSKLQPDHEVISAIEYVLKGSIYVPPWLAQIESDRLDLASGFTWDLVPTIGDRLAGLTRRQWDVLFLLARGQSNEEIARSLNITEATSQTHAAGLCRALGVSNPAEAVAVARAVLTRAATSLLIQLGFGFIVCGGAVRPFEPCLISQ